MWTWGSPLGAEHMKNIYVDGDGRTVTIMTWIYEQSTGRLWRSPRTGETLKADTEGARGDAWRSVLVGAVIFAVGYSGKGHLRADGRNNPDMEAVRATGPIPRGFWRMGSPRTSERVGPVAMDLLPSGHDAHGRSAFMIHGDDKENDASQGCIILSRRIRQIIVDSGDRDLLVIR